MYIVTNLNDIGENPHEDGCKYVETDFHLLHHGHVDENYHIPGRVEK